jgi:hypothetical protein
MRYIYNLKKVAEQGFEKYTEEQRRAENHTKTWRVGCCLLVFLVVVLLIGVIAAPARNCGKKLVLENAVCVKCEDKNCLDCSDNSKQCKKCATGFLTVNGKCRDCNVNSNSEKKCN